MSVTVCGLDGCVFWLVCGLGESSSGGGGGTGGGGQYVFWGHSEGLGWNYHPTCTHTPVHTDNSFMLIPVQCAYQPVTCS